MSAAKPIEAAEDGLPLAIDEWDGSEGVPAGVLMPRASAASLPASVLVAALAAAIPQGGVNEQVRPCGRCGLPVLERRWLDGGQGTWKQDIHHAPCGRRCRDQESTLSAEHGPKTCSACGDAHPQAARLAVLAKRKARKEARRKRR